MTRVLPLPGPAAIASAGTRLRTAARCGSFKPASSDDGSTRDGGLSANDVDVAVARETVAQQAESLPRLTQVSCQVEPESRILMIGGRVDPDNRSVERSPHRLCRVSGIAEEVSGLRQHLLEPAAL